MTYMQNDNISHPHSHGIPTLSGASAATFNPTAFSKSDFEPFACLLMESNSAFLSLLQIVPQSVQTKESCF